MSSPFKSKLAPHWEFIKRLRSQRYAWKEVAQELAKQGCTTCPSNVFRFFKRHRKRPVPLGYEDEGKAPLGTATPVPARPSWLKSAGPIPEPDDLDFSVSNPADKFYTNPKQP